MKIKTIFVALLLMSFSLILASEDPAEAEHWEKVRQLDQLAEKFKAETGFRGSVEHSTATMRLHVYQGNFPGISFTADGDTTAFRQACEGIISKVLPNSRASSPQLSVSRISKSGRGYTTEYYQQVDGYRVEGAGYIKITFEDGRKYFAISDNTVDLPKNVMVNITREEATNIAVSYHKNKFNPPDNKLVPYVIEDLRFCNPNASGYALKYIIYIGDYVYYVDSSTGELDWGNTISDDLSTFYIKGKAYDPTAESIPPSVLNDSPQW